MSRMGEEIGRFIGHLLLRRVDQWLPGIFSATRPSFIEFTSCLTFGNFWAANIKWSCEYLSKTMLNCADEKLKVYTCTVLHYEQSSYR